MALYQVDIEKFLQGPGFQNNYWTNVYYCEAASVADATTFMNAVVACERPIHMTTVTFTKGRVRLAAPGNPGSVIPLALLGTRTAGDALPLYCTFRVDLGTSIGRPSRKYLRGPVGETDNSNGSLIAGTTTLITNSYITPLLAIAALRDVDGEPFINGTAIAPVQMRQLRRGKRRLATPVI
jgi:hypothetical protein